MTAISSSLNGVGAVWRQPRGDANLAKLNGVTTLSERIQYNGVEYVKSAEDAVEGDIVRIDESCSGEPTVTNAEFYEVTRVDSADDAQVTDDDGYEYDTCGDEMTVFKRTESASATTPQDDDVVEHNGKKYRKVARDGKSGDMAVITGNSVGHQFPIGEIVRLKKGVQAEYTDGRDWWMVNYEDYAVLEPIEDATPQYTEVKRKARVGERIRIVAAEGTFGRYSNGDEFTVDRESISGGVEVDEVQAPGNSDGYITCNEYVVLEPSGDAKAERLAVVGDYVKVVKHGGGHDYSIGDIVKVTKLDVGNEEEALFYGEVVASGRRGNMLSTTQTVRANDEDVRTAQSEAERKNRLKVGEYARVLAEKHPQFGRIVEIVADDYSVKYPYDTRKLNGNSGDCYSADQLERVTLAEVGAARKQSEESAKWSAIGRKVGEIKAGDVVKGIGIHTRKLEIGTVEDICDDLLGVRRTDGYSAMNRAEVTLIAPVESLFNGR